MRTQELVHLHALLFRVATFCDLDPGAFADYGDQPVRPVSIHRSRDDHQAAVLALSRELADELEGERVEPRA